MRVDCRAEQYDFQFKLSNCSDCSYEAGKTLWKTRFGDVIHLSICCVFRINFIPHDSELPRGSIRLDRDVHVQCVFNLTKCRPTRLSLEKGSDLLGNYLVVGSGVALETPYRDKLIYSSRDYFRIIRNLDNN